MERKTARFLLPLPAFLVAQEILPQLTRTGLSRQLNTNVGDILSSCIPYALGNDIKPSVCTLVLSPEDDFSETRAIPYPCRLLSRRWNFFYLYLTTSGLYYDD